MVGPVAAYIGTAGEVAAVSLGYTTDAGVEFDPGDELIDVKVGERKGIVKQFVGDQNPMFKMTLRQSTVTQLSRLIHGSTLASSTLSISSTSTTAKTCSLKLVGLAPDGSVRTYSVLYATPRISGAMVHNVRETVDIPVEFRAMSTGTNLYTIQDGDGTEAVTLSSGAFARTAGQVFYKVSGEGAAADALTDVTGASLVNNELLILQIASTAQPITITHAADAMELDGSANFGMTSLDDVVYLRYATTGSKWVEVGRIKARTD
jgi:hypothetical protein